MMLLTPNQKSLLCILEKKWGIHGSMSLLGTWSAPDMVQISVIPLEIRAVGFDDYLRIRSNSFPRNAVCQTAVPEDEQDDAADD
jgi:hypothetical protein